MSLLYVQYPRKLRQVIPQKKVSTVSTFMLSWQLHQFTQLCYNKEKIILVGSYQRTSIFSYVTLITVQSYLNHCVFVVTRLLKDKLLAFCQLHHFLTCGQRTPLFASRVLFLPAIVCQYTLSFMCPLKKQSRDVRSGDLVTL